MGERLAGDRAAAPTTQLPGILAQGASSYSFLEHKAPTEDPFFSFVSFTSSLRDLRLLRRRLRWARGGFSVAAQRLKQEGALPPAPLQRTDGTPGIRARRRRLKPEGQTVVNGGSSESSRFRFLRTNGLETASPQNWQKQPSQ